MAREVITKYVSDLTGQDIPDGKGVSVTIKYEEDMDKPWFVLDAAEDDDEIKTLLSKARETPRRGRAPSKAA